MEILALQAKGLSQNLEASRCSGQRVKVFSGKFSSSSACVSEFRIFKVLYGSMHFYKKLCCSCVKTNFDYGFKHAPRLASK